jgi:hypothetical protein
MCGETKSLAANALSAQNFKRSVVIVLRTFGESGVVCDEVVAAKELMSVSRYGCRQKSTQSLEQAMASIQRYCKTRSVWKKFNGKYPGTLKRLP